MALIRFRCTRRTCRTRVTFPLPIGSTVAPEPCPVCKGSLKPDQWRHRHEVGPRTRAGVCRCGGWWFPHRKGSLGCAHHPGLTDDQLADYFGPYATEESVDSAT